MTTGPQPRNAISALPKRVASIREPSGETRISVELLETALRFVGVNPTERQLVCNHLYSPLCLPMLSIKVSHAVPALAIL